MGEVKTWGLMGGMETLELGKTFWGQQNNPPRTQTLGPEGQVRKKGKKGGKRCELQTHLWVE